MRAVAWVIVRVMIGIWVMIRIRVSVGIRGSGQGFNVFLSSDFWRQTLCL